MSDEAMFSSTTFDRAVLREAFPQLTEEACSDIALATLFDVLCWQIRLRLLSRRSIYRIEVPIYDDPENRYRILARSGDGLSPVARISFRYLNANQSRYVDLPDRSIFPPPPLMIMSSIVIEGDAAYVDRIRKRFDLLLKQEARQADLLWLLMRSARERLTEQPHARFALQPSVVEFYSITSAS